jgi:long-chain fatty acid transport protein
MRFIAVGLLSLFVASSAFATNGYFSHGYGTQSKGMAGAGVALSLSSLSGATNPASMIFLDQRYDVGLALFSPDRGYTVTGSPSGFPQTFPLTPGEVKSDSKLFAVPSFGANWLIGKENAIGALIYGNGGMNTNYPTTTFNGPAAPTGVDLNQLFLNATYARLLAPGHALGISGIVGYQWFKAEGLQAFGGFSSNPSSLTNNGYDNALGFGGRIGYLGHLTC